LLIGLCRSVAALCCRGTHSKSLARPAGNQRKAQAKRTCQHSIAEEAKPNPLPSFSESHQLLRRLSQPNGVNNMANVNLDSPLKGGGASAPSNFAALDSAQGKFAAAPQGAPAPKTTVDKPAASGQNTSVKSEGAPSTAPQDAAKPGTSIKVGNGVSEGTAKSANQMLADVDATLAQYGGKAPANHQERVKAVAQVADSLKGAEKTAFLQKIQAQGKAFGMNFGQKSIDDKSAFGKLDAEHQAVNLLLQNEAKGGQQKSDGSTASKKPSPEKKQATQEGVASAKEGMSDDVADLLERVKGQSEQETREMVAGWDATGDGRIAGAEVTGFNGADVSSWGDMKQAMKGHSKGLSVDDMTTMLREKAAAYGAQTK
jgi:hypothetical protein